MTVQTVQPSSLSPEARAALAVAAAHQQAQARYREAIIAAIIATWAGMNAQQLVASWFGGIGQQIFLILGLGQEAVASQARNFVSEAYRVQGHSVDVPAINASRFAGISSDGRALEELLVGAVARSFERLNRGDSAETALKAGSDFLTMVAATQISDAGRAADQVAITAVQPETGEKVTRFGWVRMLQPPSCGRCAILAGRFYRWNDGFQRHPMCDCKHIPVAEDVAGDLTTDPQQYFDSLTKEQQDELFGVRVSQAIRDGADINQVVNAATRPGAMFTADNGRRYTREGTTRRGVYGRRRSKVLRPTPWQIYKDAKGSREAAIRLLREFGYLL